jgi:hypothetical protein
MAASKKANSQCDLSNEDGGKSGQTKSEEEENRVEDYFHSALPLLKGRLPKIWQRTFQQKC